MTALTDALEELRGKTVQEQVLLRPVVYLADAEALLRKAIREAKLEVLAEMERVAWGNLGVPPATEMTVEQRSAMLGDPTKRYLRKLFERLEEEAP